MKDLAVQGNGGKWLGNEHTREPGRDRDAATRRRRRTNGGKSKKVVAQEKREGEHAETSTTPSRRYHLRLCALATIRCLSPLSLPDSPPSLRADGHHKRGLLSISSLCIPFTRVNLSLLISSSFSAFSSLHHLCRRPRTHVTHPDCALSFRNYSAYMPTSFHCHPRSQIHYRSSTCRSTCSVRSTLPLSPCVYSHPLVALSHAALYKIYVCRRAGDAAAGYLFFQ